MIFIRRAESPKTLADRPKTGDHYNKPAVVHALWDMQYGKCCYCERKLPEKGHLKAVEHFAPKAIFKGLRNEWTNLLLACAQCNGEKSDTFPLILSDGKNEDKVLYQTQKHDGSPAIIDPTSVDPEEHLDFDFTGEEWRDNFGVIMARNRSVLGAETISTVGLHGSFYANLHWNYYSKVLSIYYLNLLQAQRDGDALSFQARKTSFETLMAPQTEFAGCARAFARFKKLDKKPFELKIPGPSAGVVLTNPALSHIVLVVLVLLVNLHWTMPIPLPMLHQR